MVQGRVHDPCFIPSTTLKENLKMIGPFYKVTVSETKDFQIKPKLYIIAFYNLCSLKILESHEYSLYSAKLKFRKIHRPNPIIQFSIKVNWVGWCFSGGDLAGTHQALGSSYSVNNKSQIHSSCNLENL